MKDLDKIIKEALENTSYVDPLLSVHGLMEEIRNVVDSLTELYKEPMSVKYRQAKPKSKKLLELAEELDQQIDSIHAFGK